MTDHAKQNYTRLNIIERAWLRVLLWWHQDQATTIEDRTVPRIQDECNRGITPLAVLTTEKCIMRHHQNRVREIRERLAAG